MLQLYSIFHLNIAYSSIEEEQRHEVIRCCYWPLLGFRPDIALINEQAYSAGLVQHYIDAGYRAIAMEWDNPYRCHPEWNPEWRYFPQIACGQHGEEIPLIWNNAIAFQKFQRYAHGEMELDEYKEYLCGHLSDQARSFSLYGNDVEIFDFRPGRYHTEASLHEDGEWMRIWLLFESLLSDKLHTSESGARSDGRWDRNFFLELGGFWDKSGGYSFLDLCLRADERDGIARALYISETGKRVIILRIFIKKTQKTPKKEIRIALSRIQEIK